jgi:hypothetical protein
MLLQNCPQCHSLLFAAVPFKTTRHAIVEFAQGSSLPDKEAIIEARWIHPGLYCPNGCYRELWEYGSALMPQLALDEALTVVQEYAVKYLADFTATHGQQSRCLACVHCKKFDGASLEGQPPDSFYRNPRLKPLSDKRFISARCKDPRIRALRRAWWYDQGENRPDCEYFMPDSLFKFIYQRITGWHEYPD